MLRLIKNLEQLLVIALLMLFAALLGGCADKGSVILDTPLGGTETVSDDMGRYSAWAKAETARITALKSLGTSKEEKEAKEKIVVTLDTQEKILQWTLLKTTEAMGEAMKSLANGRRDEAIASSLKQLPMPKGAVAEGIESVGMAIKDIGNTPAAIVGTTGAMAVQLTKAATSGAGDRTTITGDGNSYEKTNNQSQVIADNGSTSTGAPTGNQQTQVTPEPEPEEEEAETEDPAPAEVTE